MLTTKVIYIFRRELLSSPFSYHIKENKIFGELYIGKHPTPDRNKYLVLALNFSSVASSMERLEESFNTYCKIVMTGFAERNAHLLGEEAVDV